MGTGQSSEAFFKRFQDVTLAETSRNELWHIYRAGTSIELGKIAELDYAEAMAKEAKAAASTGGISSSSASPNQIRITKRFEIAKQYTNAPIGSPVVILEVNKQHKSVPPSKGSSKHKYSLLDVSRGALEFVMLRPHYTLPHVVDVQPFPASEELCAVIKSPRLDPVIESIHNMCASEILYGMSCITRGLVHLHRNGFVHRNLSWRAIYKDPTSAQQHWVIMDFQFMFNQRLVFSTVDSEHAISLLTEIRALREAKDLELVAPEDNNPGSTIASELPIGACDMYAFGVMIDELIGTQGPARSTSAAFTQVVSPFGNPDCATVAVLASLKDFASRCKHGNPHKRPTAGEFLLLPCIQSSVFVNIMTFCDTMPSKTNEEEKILFFSFLHLELLKLPYDLVTTRLLPRLMSQALWSEPSAEPFLKHLLTPFIARAKDDCAYLRVPMRPDIQEAFDRAPLAGDVPQHQQPPTKKHVISNSLKKRGIGAKKKQETGEEDAHSDAGEVPAEADPARPAEKEDGGTGVDRYIMNRMGVLHPPEFRNLTRKLRETLDPTTVHLGQPSFLCAILRCAHGFLMSDTKLLFNQVVPYTIACLRHSCVDVVLEALHLFSFLVQKLVHDPSAPKRHTPESQAAVASLKRAFDTDIFNIAFAESQCVNIRVLALGMAAKSIQLKENGIMQRPLAVSALLLPLVDPTASRHPTNEEEGDVDGNGCSSICVLHSRIAIRKSLDYTWKLRKRMHPFEIAEQIIPSLAVLTVRLNEAAHEAVGTHLPDASPTLNIFFGLKHARPVAPESLLESIVTVSVAPAIVEEYPSAGSLEILFGSSTSQEKIKDENSSSANSSCLVETQELRENLEEPVVEVEKEEASAETDKLPTSVQQEGEEKDEDEPPTYVSEEEISPGTSPSRSVRMSSASSDHSVEEKEDQQEQQEEGEQQNQQEEKDGEQEVHPPTKPDIQAIATCPYDNAENEGETLQHFAAQTNHSNTASHQDQREDITSCDRETASMLRLVQACLQRRALTLALPSSTTTDPYVRRHLEAAEALKRDNFNNDVVVAEVNRLTERVEDRFGNMPGVLREALSSLVADLLSNPAHDSQFPGLDSYSIEQLWFDAHNMFEGFVQLLKEFSPAAETNSQEKHSKKIKHSETPTETETALPHESVKEEILEDGEISHYQSPFWSPEPKNWNLAYDAVPHPLGPVINGIPSLHEQAIVDPAVYTHTQQSLQRPLNSDPTYSQLGSFDEMVIPKPDTTRSSGLPIDAYYFSFHDYDNEWNTAPLFTNASHLSTSRHAETTVNTMTLRLQPLAQKLPTRCGKLPSVTDNSLSTKAVFAPLSSSATALPRTQSYISPFDTKKGKKIRAKMNVIDNLTRDTTDHQPKAAKEAVDAPSPQPVEPVSHTAELHVDPTPTDVLPSAPRHLETSKTGAPKRRVTRTIATVDTLNRSTNGRSLTGSFVSIPPQQPVTSAALEEFEL